MKKMRVALALLISAFTACFVQAQVAKVGNTEYTTIDEAIANWTNGATLTLLSDVTLSKTIEISSTEYRVLDLGTYTMTAASRKDAIQIVNNGRSSASYALDIKADATNPGGITASGKAVVKTTGKSGVKDRPIIRFYGGVLTGSNVVSHSGSNGTNCPQFWFYGGEFNGTLYANRALFQFYGGTFNGNIQISVDSSAYALVSGGRFKKLSNLYGSSLNSDKFTIGSAKGNYNRSIYVDKDGYYVVTSETITEVSAKYPAVKKESYNSNNYFYYSAAATYGMFYKVASMAGTGSNVTVYVPAVTIPESVTGDTAVVEEIKNNTALEDYTPENLPTGAKLVIELKSVEDEIVYDVTPMANDVKVDPTEAITFRLPVPASVTEAYAKVYHEGTLMGIYAIQGEGSAKYVEVSSADFSEFAIEPIETAPVSKIGEVYYATLAEAVAAATEGQTITLTSDVQLAETLTIPAGKTLTIDLNGKAVSHTDEANKYAINNLGTLTLKDSVGTGSVNARGIYNGYGNGGENVPSAKLIVQGGTYNAKGTNGGAAIFNYGIAEINGGSFTSIGGYSLNNQAGSSMTIADGVTANNGIYCSNAKVTVNGGNISGNRSGCHVVYAWNSELTINGGTFYNNNSGNATIMSAGTTKCTINDGTFGIKDGRVEGNGNTWTSCLTDTANTATMTVTGGTFNGGFRVQAGTTMTIEGGSFNDVGGSGYGIYGTASVKGGTFTDATAKTFAANNLAVGYTLGENGAVVAPVAKIGDVYYTSLQAAINAAQADDTVIILPGEYGAINISNKNITIKGTVGDNGELLTTIKGGNPAIIGHNFNGTIKDIKIVDAFKVMYAEPAGNVTVDNVYVTGATYGFHLVAYTQGLAWTIQNSYMDLSWANSFGVAGNGDAAIVIKGNTFESTSPYYPDYGALVVNTFLPNVTVEQNVFGENAKIMVRESIADTSNINISKNYHANGVDNAFVDDSAKVGIYEYYSDEELQNLVVRAAKIGDNYYASLEAAVEATQAGDEIVLLLDATLSAKLTLPAGITFNGNGKSITGAEVWADGNLAFVGHTKMQMFNAGYNKPTITIGEGACLELTSTDRMVIGHGATFNITGNITDAKTANVADITPSLIAAGASFTGAGVNFNVTNAYVKFTAYCSSKNSSANDTFNINVNNSIWEQTGSLVFTEPTNGKDPTFNFNVVNSVLNSTSHLVFGVTKGEIVFDNSNVNVGTSRQIENRSTMTIKNGSVVNGAVATSSNAKNPGTVIVENATYAVTGEFSGSDVGTGTLIVKKGANVTMGKITKANIQIDATDMTEGELANFTANLSGLSGTLTVVNNNTLDASIVDGKIVLAKKPVAQIGEQTYTTLEAAFAAAAEGQTITLLMDATPALVSQRAITKAAVIDLGGKTLTLTEDDLYFGTTTFKNGTIVVDPSVKPSTAVFWMFANQTLTFDNVKVVATGVTGTYLIGLDGNNSDLNLLNGSEIFVDNTTALDLDIICVNASTGNDIVIDNSKIYVTNLDGRVLFRGNYTIKGSSEINLEGITKAGIRIEAGQTLSIEDTAKVTITGEPRDGGIHLTDVTATYTKADTATVNATINEVPAVAKIGTAKYASLQAAINAVKDGDTITLVADITEDVTLTEKTGLYYTIDGLGKKMNGTITISSLSDTNDNRRITIKNINFVTTEGRDFITSTATNHYPRITVEGCTFTGTGDGDTVAIRLKSSHSVVIKDCTGTGLHSFLQNTAGWNLTVENVTVTESKSGLALGTVQGVTVKGCEIAVAGYGIRLDAGYNNNAVIDSNKITAFIPVVVRKASVDSNVTVSGSNTMTATNTDGLWFAIGTSEYETNGTMPTAPTGKVVVTLNDTGLNASGVYGNYGVALVNGVKYVTLKDAVAAVADGGIITLIGNVTITEATRTHNSGSWYDGIYYVGDKSFTIDLGGFTVTQDGSVNDYLLNFKNDGSKANTITLKNGTIDAGTVAYCAICTSSTSTQKITINLEQINVINNNSNGSTIKVRGGAELNVKSGAKITGKNSYLAIECVASTVNIYDGAEIYMNGTSSYNGCLVGACGGGVVNVYGGYGKGVKGGFIAMTSGGTINVSGGEWIANTDGTVGNNSNLYVLTAQNNKNENGYVGASIINVTGGTFRGGMDAWVLNDAKVEKAELNIAGGNFNANPTTYLDEGYVVIENNGVYTVAKAVAKVGDTFYTNLVDAFKAATSGCTIEILSDVTIDYKWDCRDYATGGSHSQFKEAVTINGNGHTLKFTGTISDGNWNTIFRFEENATVNNLTVDISEATGAQRVISAKKSLTVDGLTIVGSAKYGIIFGEGASATDFAAAEIVVKNSTLTGTRRAISDNEGGKDVKSVVITGNNLKANVYASAFESITFNNNTAAGEVDLRSYTAENVLSVEAKGNTLTAGVKNYIYAKDIDAQEGFTAERPWDGVTIANLKQLKMFRDAVNAGDTYAGKTVTLMADIDLSSVDNWEPIGNVGYNNKYAPVDSTKVFRGIFDANGKVISNLTMTKIMNGGADAEANLGLFGITGEGAVIKNLTLTNVTITTDGRNVGALVAFAHKTTLDAITVNGNIQIKGGNNVAGVCAMTRYHAMSATNITVVGNDGSVVEGNNIVGGIFAEIAPNGSAQTFKNLSVDNVAINGKGGVGGIVGLLTLGTVENATVKNVAITANTLYNGDAMGRIRMGSVAGLLGDTSATIINATVEDVTAKNLDGNAVVLPVIGANYTGSIGNATEAKIGNTYYATLAKAYAAAQAGDTITLLKPIVVKAGEDLNLNKAVTITYTSAVPGEDMITNKGTLIVDGASLIYTNTDTTASNVTVSTISCEPGSLLEVKSGLVQNDSANNGAKGIYAYAIDLLTNGSMGDVTATISGGKVISNYITIRQFNNGTAKNTLTVTGGEIEGAKRAIQIHLDNNAAYTTISGGTITAGEGGYALCFFPTTAEHISVTGGTFTGMIYSGTEEIISGGTFAEEPYAGYIAAGYACTPNDDGTYGVADDPATHYIASLADLIAFRDSVNAGTTYEGVTVYLTADIDMASVDWSNNIGDAADASFDGVFDGQDHKILNLNSTETAQDPYGYICTGLFGCIAGDASIQNLTLENVTIDTATYTGNNVAALVGFAWSCTGTIDNVTVKNVTINATNATGVGAIVGYDYYSPALKIANCTVDGTTIAGKSYVGGVIGYASTKIQLNNNTVMNLSLSGTASVGGVAGIMLAGGSASDNTIYKVTLSATGAMWANSVGAVAGTMTNGSITVAGTTVTGGNVTDIVGGILVEKPTKPIEKVQAQIGDTFYTDAATARKDAEALAGKLVARGGKTGDKTGVDAFNTMYLLGGSFEKTAEGTLHYDYAFGVSNVTYAGNDKFTVTVAIKDADSTVARKLMGRTLVLRMVVEGETATEILIEDPDFTVANGQVTCDVTDVALPAAGMGKATYFTVKVTDEE